MSEVKTQPVKATRFENIDDVENMPGAFEYFRDGDRYPAGMIYTCPCGCGRIVSLDFRPHSSPSWEWDGNREAPTLSPSVHHVGHWHGYLRNGVWESC
ncbi:MAG: DUF6527 family protein [Hyphomicrobium sp.]|jgi:hypothetical protein